MKKHENDIIEPIINPLQNVIKTTCKTVYNILGFKTVEQIQQEEEEAMKKKEEKERRDREKREEEIEKQNKAVINKKLLNFNELFINCGLKNKLKDMPTLEKIRSYQPVDIYSFKLPVGVTVSTVQQKIEDIADFFEVSQMNIKLQKKNGLMDIIITKDNLFNRVFEYEDMKLSEGLKIPMGHFVNQDYMEKMLVVDMSKDNIPHAFIGSTTGGGKSNFIRIMLLNWIMNKTPKDLELFLIDGKGGTDYAAFVEAPHVFMNRCFNDDYDVEAILEGAVEEILRRNQLFIRTGANNFSEYVSLGSKLSRKVIVFDEYAMYHGRKVFSSIQSKVGKICSTGRSAGVHIIVATQDGRKEILDSMIKYNMPLKIGFKCSNTQHSMNVSGYVGLETINRIGVGRVYGLPIDTEYIQFKTMKAPSSKKIRDMIKRKYGESTTKKEEGQQTILEVEVDVDKDMFFGEECEE